MGGFSEGDVIQVDVSHPPQLRNACSHFFASTTQRRSSICWISFEKLLNQSLIQHQERSRTVMHWLGNQRMTRPKGLASSYCGRILISMQFHLGQI